jgi:hypothetical protein
MQNYLRTRAASPGLGEAIRIGASRVSCLVQKILIERKPTSGILSYRWVQGRAPAGVRGASPAYNPAYN